MPLDFFYIPLVAFVVSYLSLKVAFYLSNVFGLLDTSDNRKRHKGNVPLVGGISIFFGVFSGMYFFIDKHPNLLHLFMASSIILILGVVDDRKPLPVVTRIFFQITAVIILISGDVKISTLGNFLGQGEMTLTGWTVEFVTILSVIGLINAINFLDGIDGLAASMSIMFFSFLFFLFSGIDQNVFQWFCVIFSVSILPFLLFNLGFFGSKSRIFLGDAGSVLLGLLSAWLAIQASQVEASVVVAPVTMLWLLAIPIIDTMSVVVRMSIPVNPATQSDLNRPPNPEHSGHPRRG